MNFTKSTYQDSFRITSTDTDAAYECRPSALLVYIQRAIVAHAQLVEASRDDMLEKYNGYWMVLRIRVALQRPLIWGETLTVKVSVRKPVGTRVYRDCGLFVGQEQVGQAVTSWVLANRSTHRAMGLEHLPELPEEDPPEALSQTLSRIVFPADMTLHDRRRLYYSDTDVNGHMGNTRYVDLAADAAELDRRPHGVFLRELTISYIGECFAGEILDLYRGKENGRLFIHGVGPEGTDRFDCVIRMSSDEGL